MWCSWWWVMIMMNISRQVHADRSPLLCVRVSFMMISGQAPVTSIGEINRKFGAAWVPALTVRHAVTVCVLWGLWGHVGVSRLSWWQSVSSPRDFGTAKARVDWVTGCNLGPQSSILCRMWVRGTFTETDSSRSLCHLTSLTNMWDRGPETGDRRQGTGHFARLILFLLSRNSELTAPDWTISISHNRRLLTRHNGSLEMNFCLKTTIK